MKRRARLLVATSILSTIGVVFALIGSVQAHDEATFVTGLSGFQETPAIYTPGYGYFRATLSGDRTSLSYVLKYTNLRGDATAAHIHFGQRSVDGGAVAFLCGGGGKPACPAHTGSVSGMIAAADVMEVASQGIGAGQFARLVRAMRLGLTYANVHTASHPEGELRGQIRRT